MSNKRTRLGGLVRGGGLTSLVSGAAPPAEEEEEAPVAPVPSSNVATLPAGNVATDRPTSRSWGVGAPLELREALNLLIAKQRIAGHRLTLADLVEEALVDLLHKYGEPIPDLAGEDEARAVAMADEQTALVPVRQQQVAFYGDALPAGQLADGTVLVPLKPICEALGVDWSSQVKRLRRDPVLDQATCSMVITTIEGYPRPMLALPLKLLPGFLFGLSAARVRPELQAKILRYQADCYEVLWTAFKGDILPTPPASGASGAALAVEIAEAVAALARQQLAFEQAAGARLDRLTLAVTDTTRRLSAIEMRLDPKQVLTEEQAAELALAVKHVGQRLASAGDRQGYAKVYSELYRRYRVSSYKNLPQGKLAEVLAWLGAWAAELGG